MMFLLLPLACTPEEAADTDTAAVTDTDTAADTDTDDTDTDDTGTDDTDDTDDTNDTDDTDTDTSANEDALLRLEGAADVGETYVGTEAVDLLSNFGLGDELCRITYTVTSTARRDDCADCVWAFDVVLGAPTVDYDAECAAAGYDAAAIAAIEGTTRSIGVAVDYLGHADALLLYDGRTWVSASFVDWVDAEWTLRYAWDQAYVTY
jgi:hypothetical protein